MSQQSIPKNRSNSNMLEIIFYKSPMAIIGCLILVGVVINFANVVSRHIFQAAIFWAEEILVFIVVWSVFVGVIAVTYRGAHLRMDLVSTRIGQPWKTMINGLTFLAFIAGGVFAILQSVEVLSLLAKNEQVSVTASVPMIVPHSAILIGFVFMVVAVIARWQSYIKGEFDQ